MSSQSDWSRARDSMLLDPAIAYLNSGSAGPLPRSVYARVSDFRRRLAEEPLDFLLRDTPALLCAARKRLAEFVGGEPSRLALTTNVTSAVNLLASGLELDSPGEILMTDYEYTPMRWCWERAAARQGLDVRILRLPVLPAEPGEILEAAQAALGPRTRLFFFSHVLASTGTVLPVKQLCAAARTRGVLTVVDGAHGPAFTDLDMADLGCDYYVGVGHKWLLAPTGTGFLHFGTGGADRLRPMQVSWGYHSFGANDKLDERDNFGRTPALRSLEVEGTRDICPWLALPDAIDFQAALGHNAVQARMRELAGHVRECLSGWRGLAPATPQNPHLHVGMTAFDLPHGTDPAWLRRQLWERYRIEISAVEGNDGPLLRVSTHFFNTEIEAERLRDALGELS